MKMGCRQRNKCYLAFGKIQIINDFNKPCSFHSFFLLLFECGHYVLLPLILDFYYVFVPGFTVGDVIN